MPLSPVTQVTVPCLHGAIAKRIDYYGIPAVQDPACGNEAGGHTQVAPPEKENGGHRRPTDEARDNDHPSYELQ